MIKVAILYICTGKYDYFFDEFYSSCNKYFLKGIAEVKYFVFTDSKQITDNGNIVKIFRECQGFPKDSLFRFEMFLSIKEELLNYDYIFFFNSNMLFLDYVGEEFLPKTKETIGVLHPGHYNNFSFFLPYERNKKSKAYIPPHLKKYRYFMGGVNGGKSREYINLIEECHKNIVEDYNNGIIARFHDESHINKYFLEKGCEILPPSYGYPEGWDIPFKPIILIRDKTKIDSYFNKGRDHSILGKSKRLFSIIIDAIKWYI